MRAGFITGKAALLPILGIAAGAAILAACSQEPSELSKLPAADKYCLAAQRVVTRTEIPMQLVVHKDFDAFVKSKAVIEGPTIQQYNWFGEGGELLGISCKLKSADHLNMVFGAGSAGPDGLCQDMNRAVFGLLTTAVHKPAFKRVSFDAAEAITNTEQPGMTGPDWLAPYTMTYVKNGTLHIASKGFVVDFSDPRYARAPERFRGVHYCHLLAPGYLQALLNGEAEAGVVIGREVDRSGPPPDGQ